MEPHPANVLDFLELHLNVFGKGVERVDAFLLAQPDDIDPVVLKELDLIGIVHRHGIVGLPQEAAQAAPIVFELLARQALVDIDVPQAVVGLLRSGLRVGVLGQ